MNEFYCSVKRGLEFLWWLTKLETRSAIYVHFLYTAMSEYILSAYL